MREEEGGRPYVAWRMPIRSAVGAARSDGGACRSVGQDEPVESGNAGPAATDPGRPSVGAEQDDA